MSSSRLLPVVRSLLRPSLLRPSLLRPSLLQPRLSSRLLGTQSPVSAVTRELSEALSSEIEAEKDLERKQLEDGKAPSMPGWKIDNDGPNVTLTKDGDQHGDKITVKFNVNHSVDMDEDDMDADHQHDSEQSTHQMPVSRPMFTVTVEKNATGERLCMELEIVDSDDGESPFDFHVEEFYIAPKDDGKEINVYSSSGKYIDEQLYELLFTRYLEERGIDAEFCENLVRFATHYEHAQYVLLLQKIKSFVTK